MTAEVEIPKGAANGVIIAQGGAFAGWSHYLHEGKPKYCHNPAGLMRFCMAGSKKERASSSSTAGRSVKVASTPRCP